MLPIAFLRVRRPDGNSGGFITCSQPAARGLVRMQLSGILPMTGSIRGMRIDTISIMRYRVCFTEVYLRVSRQYQRLE